jgi:addiction module HigA family antidote
MAANNKPVVEPQVELQKLVEKYQLSVNQIAEDIGLSLSGARQVLTGKSRITVNIGLKLAKYFSKADDYWINLQCKYDVDAAKKDQDFAAALRDIEPAIMPVKKASPKAAASAKAKAPAKEKSSSKSKSPNK